MAEVVKAMHTTSTRIILLESLPSDDRFGILTDTQAIDVVTFYFKALSAALLIIK